MIWADRDKDLRAVLALDLEKIVGESKENYESRLTKKVEKQKAMERLEYGWYYCKSKDGSYRRKKISPGGNID